MVSIDAASTPYGRSERLSGTAPQLERSRRLNTVLLVIIALLLMFGALGGTYLYSVVSGLSSSTGATGAPGNNGLPGVDGSDGADGTDGSTGPAGSSGTDGTDGRNGANGQDGADGQPGLNGVDGAPGADGVTLYNSGQGVVDLGACDSNVDVRLRSRLEGSTFYLSSVTLSGISSECWGSTIDLYVLGGANPDWTTLTSSLEVAVSGEAIVINRDQFDVDDIPSSQITRIALEIR